MSSIKFSFRILNWSFSTFRAWHSRTGAKLKKCVPKQKKATLKLELREITISDDQDSLTKSYTTFRGFRKRGANLTSWSLTFGPIFAQKNRNTAKSNCIFNSKLRPDRAQIFGYLDSPMDKLFPRTYLLFRFRISSWGKLGLKLDQKNNLWERPVVVKIWRFVKA